MRHFKHQILFILIVLYSCGHDNQSGKVQTAAIDTLHNDTLFKNFDTLENKWNSTPVNFDTFSKTTKYASRRLSKSQRNKIDRNL